MNLLDALKMIHEGNPDAILTYDGSSDYVSDWIANYENADKYENEYNYIEEMRQEANEPVSVSYLATCILVYVPAWNVPDGETGRILVTKRA